MNLHEVSLVVINVVVVVNVNNIYTLGVEWSGVNAIRLMRKRVIVLFRKMDISKVGALSKSNKNKINIRWRRKVLC